MSWERAGHTLQTISLPANSRLPEDGQVSPTHLIAAQLMRRIIIMVEQISDSSPASSWLGAH